MYFKSDNEESIHRRPIKISFNTKKNLLHNLSLKGTVSLIYFFDFVEYY